LGVSILLAQGLLLVVPALLLLARPRSWRLVALAVIPLALALAANAVRNHAIEPGFHPLGANGGVTLAHGNDLGSAGRYSPLPGSDATKRHQHIQARATAEAELGRELSWSEVDGYWRSRTLRGLAGDPLGAARLWLAKLWRFTTADYLSLDTSLDYARSRAPVLYAAPLGFHVVALLAIGALSGAAARRGWPRPIAAVVAATLATCLLFFPDERYRMAATLALCVPAAFGLHALLRSTPWRRAAFGASFVALVLFDLVGSRDLRGDLVAATNHASNLEWSGRKAAALTLYQQEYAAHPRLGAARGVARLLLETQQQEAALAYLDDALERFPRDASLHNERGVALERSGDTAAARAEFRSALAAAATLPEPHLNLARLAADAGSPARAVQHYRAYVRMVPESQRGWFGLARELFRSRAPADRVRPPLARALELAAGNTARLAQAHHLEGLLLERSGDPAGAVRAYDRAVELDPDFAAPRRHRERARSAAAAPTPRPDGGARNFEARE
jgi:tetratricopeptide (TPR) repeat protein